MKNTKKECGKCLRWEGGKKATGRCSLLNITVKRSDVCPKFVRLAATIEC